MNLKQIHRFLVSGRFVILLYILLAFLGRIFAGITFQEYIPWLVFVIQTGIALSLLQINQEHSIILKKTVLPSAFFLLLTAVDSRLYYDLMGNLSAFVFVLCLIITLKNYHNPESQPGSLYIALILTTGGVLCWQPLLFFIPLFWIGFYFFRSMNIKSFAASLMGIFTVYLFLAAWYLYKEDWSLFFENLPELNKIFGIQWPELSLINWLFWAFIFFLLIITAVEIFISGLSGKIKTTTFFKYLYLLIALLFAFAFLFDRSVDGILLIICVPVSFTIGYYFSVLDDNKWVTYLFFFTILSFVGYYVFHVY